MSELSMIKLGDIGKISMCKRVLKNQTSSNGEIPFYKISTFGGKADCFISRELYEEYKTKYSFPKKGAILISAAGTLGRTVIYNGEEAFFQDSNIVWVDNDESKVTNSFLYYYYKLQPWKKTTGSTIERLYNDNLRDIDIIFPADIKEQERITNVLKNIDNKIINNNKIISELESMAKTIYDYWFLQYEFPNEEGKPYKSSGGKMVYSEELKREIPESWTVEKLEDMLEILKDGTHNPPKRIEHGIPLLTGTMFGKNFLDYKEATYISKDDYEKIHATYAPKENDLIITKIGTLGNVNYLTKEDIPLAIHCNSALLRFKKQYKNVFPFLLLKSDEFQLRMKALRGKSIQEFISLNKLGSIVCLIPDTHKIERFENYLNGIFEKMKAIRKEDEELTKLRDELLPLLMNGQVSFKN